MPNPEHVAIVRGGPQVVAEWIVTGAGGLPRFDLSYAELRGADLSGAVLAASDFRGADLSAADLSRTDVRGAIFTRTNLDGADFGEAVCWGTLFADLDLTTTRGLDRIIHCGPSSLDIATIMRTSGALPRDFLGACGVSEPALAVVDALRACGRELVLPSCFISYSDRDRDFASLLHDGLQNAGIRCFFAPEHIRGGQPILEQLDFAIRGHDRVVLVLSRSSIKSHWVKTEVIKARRRERHERVRLLFPISIAGLKALDGWECLDPVTGEDIARELRGYFIPDFSDWKHPQQFNAALQRLIRDLRDTPAYQAQDKT